LDLVLPRTRIGEDTTVGAYVGARLGREVVDRLVDPLLGGVYAGRADDLSLAATVPVLHANLGRHRTLIGAARAVRRSGRVPAGAPVFATLRGGLGRLPDAVLAASGAAVRTQATVRAVSLTASGFELVVGDARSPETVTADGVILAVPSRPAARLLTDIAPDAAREIGVVDYANVAIVTLAYRRTDMPPLHGTGFLVPTVDGRTTKAVTYASRKWSHLAPDDLEIIRASVGRYGDERALHADDEALTATVAGELSTALGLPTRPVETRVTRWGGGLPQYTTGHLDRVRRARSALPARLVVCGAAYDGVGIPACVRSGREAAAQLAGVLRQSRGGSKAG
jgi:oxygen-dependent protoporphyrinogen oxidase